jgi:hypothetical protein
MSIFLPERNLAKTTSRDNESVDRDNNALSNDTAVTMGNLFKADGRNSRRYQEKCVKTT